MKGIVVIPFHDGDGRKYIEIRISSFNIIKLKIPFRYNRIMCTTEGLKTIQELIKNDEIEFDYEIKKWNGVETNILTYCKYANNNFTTG